MALTRGPLFSRDTKRNCTTIRRQLEDTLNALPTKKQNVSLKREQIDHIKERIRDLEMRINIETGPEKNNLEREKTVKKIYCAYKNNYYRKLSENYEMLKISSTNWIMNLAMTSVNNFFQGQDKYKNSNVKKRDTKLHPFYL